MLRMIVLGEGSGGALPPQPKTRGSGGQRPPAKKKMKNFLKTIFLFVFETDALKLTFCPQPKREMQHPGWMRKDEDCSCMFRHRSDFFIF